MPSKTKRKSARKAQAHDSSDFDIPGSSPPRPTTKRRKVNGTRTSNRRKSPASDLEPVLPEHSGDESETASQGDIIDSVISYLQVSKEPVVAVSQHANDKQQDDNTKVSAYAKIAGREWTYFVRDQSVNIGRPPDDRQSVNGLGASSPIADLKDVLPVHIDLGPSKIVSRHHASIFYDSDYPDGGGWHVRVNGRNGVRVDNILLKRSSRQQISSGTILEIAGTQMMFVTPSDPVQINQYFIDQAKIAATTDELAPASHAEPTSARLPPAPGYQSLAPAPPDYKRAATPPSQQLDGRNQRGVFDSKATMSPMYGRGMMMESTQEIDYSRDSAKDLKPPYSYANMIAQAIFSTPEEKMTLSNIYSFIADKYAFYRHSNSGWQNSIRHNLSLNKAFQKVPRRTDEPGKGMKWQIAPEFRDEYRKKQAKRNGGSAPSSPASSKEVNPNFRGPNGQNLGYDTTMVSSFSAKDAGPNFPGRITFQLQPNYTQPLPPGPNYPPPQSQEAITPQRRRADTGNTLPDSSILDDSPLPHRLAAQTNGPQTYALPTPHPPHHHSPTQPNRNPTLSSSYMDTPFHPSHHHAIITPAPIRQNPRLAPPSTLVAPSKFMPESSPAGPGLFWKGIMGVTPGQAVPDMSPVKVDVEEHDERQARGGLEGRNGIGRLSTERHVMSSSPPPMEGWGSGSPSKTGPGRGSQAPSSAVAKRDASASFRHSQNDGEGDVEMRSRSASAAAGVSASVAPIQFNANANAKAQMGMSGSVERQEEQEEEADDGGFDLAKGFAPIAGMRRPGSVNAR